MTYSSLLFIYGFLPVSLLVYRVIPQKFKQLSLLLLSGVFYALNSLWFLGFMITYVLVNYLCGLFIYKYSKKKLLSGIFLFIGISVDLLIFFMFKTDWFAYFKNKLGILQDFFPIGISFVMLTSVGYIIDVFKKSMRPEFDFIKFALYIMFFPKLFIIVRYKTFLRMPDNEKLNLNDIGTGFKIFVKGLIKKVIAGDTMYMLYMAIKSIDIYNLSTISAWLGITAYLLYIYFVLSGVSDMGAGIGYCFGYRLPQSFNYPVFSNRIRDFTSKWHIQIIYWFRRYISKPLGELNKNRIYKKFILILVWGFVGLWYRFDVNGLICGVIFGFSIVLEKYLCKFRLLKITGIIYTYIITVVCMVFMSCDNVSQALNYLFVMIGGNKIIADSVTWYFLKYYIVVLLICMYFSTNLFRNLLIRSDKTFLKNVISLVSPILTVILFIICTILISYTGSSEMLLML